jgi:hypothetical protein
MSFESSSDIRGGIRLSASCESPVAVFDCHASSQDLVRLPARPGLFVFSVTAARSASTLPAPRLRNAMPELYRLRVVLFGHLVSPLTKRTATERTLPGLKGSGAMSKVTLSPINPVFWQFARMREEILGRAVWPNKTKRPVVADDRAMLSALHSSSSPWCWVCLS